MSAALSRRQRYRLTLVATLGLMLVLGMGSIKPLVDELQAKQAELEQAKSELPPEHRFNPSFAALKSQLEGLRTELAAKRRSFPVAENVSTLLIELEAMASDQVVISHFYPTKLAAVKLPKKQAQSGISVSEQQIELEADGPFDHLFQLLARFQDYAHPVGVHAIVMERLASDDQATIKAGGGPMSRPAFSERLRLKIRMSAYLLNKALPDVPVFGAGLGSELEKAQDDTGVHDPFCELASVGSGAMAARAPSRSPTLSGPSAHETPEPVPSKRDELAAWKLEGVLYGPGNMAIVRKSQQPSISVRVGDTLEGWRIARIKPRAVYLTKGMHHAELSLPEGVL